jgi:hypothetical protein
MNPKGEEMKMLKRLLVLILVAALGSPQPGAAQGNVDTDLANGVRQAQEGDFENAVVTLDGVVRRLSGQPSRAKDLARAYTYLSIAYLGLSQEQTAKAKFLEAWKADREMDLSPREFPPRILEFFEKAREEANLTSPAAPTPTSSPRPAVAREAEPQKKGSKTIPILIGAAVLGGVGVAVAAGGSGNGGGGTPTPTPQAGPLSFRLSWSTVSDLDLYVIEPSGNQLSWENPASSTGGSLDRDLVCAPGVETIAWPGTAPRGTYTFFASFSQACASATTASFTITVSQGNSVVATRTGTFSEGTQSQRFTFVN